MQKVDYVVFGLVIALLLIGVLFSYSLPIFLEMNRDLPPYFFMKKYLLISGVGLFFMILIAYLNPDKWFNAIGAFFFIVPGITVIVMPFLPETIVPTINGARRWIDLGLVKLAPVEFFKVGLIWFLAVSFNRKIKPSPSLQDEFKILLPYFVVLGIFAFLILSYFSDLGQVIVMGFIFAAMLYAAGGRGKTIKAILSGGIVLFILAIISSPYRLARIKGWLATISANIFPLPIVTSNSYSQVKASLNAIYHGGFSGVGLGNGIFKLGFLSDVHTDFVLAGIAEESGVVAIFLIISIFLFLIYRLIKLANRSENRVYQLFILGVATLIATQFIINGLGVTSIFPIKGLTVPFLSYGGSSIFALSIAMGMVLMLSKRAKL